MAPSAALLMAPFCRHDVTEKEDLHAATLLAAQSVRDLRLAERVQQALRATGYPSLRAVEVTVSDRRVLLRGCVPSYYMKQVAQAKALTVSGVRELCNQLTVVRSRWSFRESPGAFT